MPYAPRKFIKPEVFLRHRGRIIYHAYRNDEMEGGRLAYSFTAAPDDLDFDWRFDIRELAVWRDDPFPATPQGYPSPDTFWDDESRHIRKLVKRAIDAGEINFCESA